VNPFHGPSQFHSHAAHACIPWKAHTNLLASTYYYLSLLLLGAIHGEGVHEGAGDGDGGTDDGTGGHGGLEGDDGGNDDDDALDGVAHGVGDGVDLLVVEGRGEGWVCE